MCPKVVVGFQDYMSKFVTRVSNLIVNECWTIMLIEDMDISQLMNHVQNIKAEKLKKGEREKKRASTVQSEYSQQKLGEGIILSFRFIH